ncbi:kelch-like protein [Archangium minus]|uniref:Kelch-like protein n=1 Tax=Archangium minus TaxID=83450 RepID=A0ABY9WY84_9BACT|nr:kelch-like protein [Archangium minus]
MSLLRLSAFLPLVLAVLAGCGSPPPSSGPAPTGAMRLTVQAPTAVPSDVSRVTVTVSGADMASQSTDLVLTDGVWGGVMGDIPAGSKRTFLAQAFTAASVLRYEGRAEDVTVTAGSTGLVSLTLQEVSGAPPFTNEAPVLDSLVANPLTVVPGGTVSLSAIAHDPNAGDTVSYAWTAPSGSFSAPAQASTTWTAPGTQGVVRLTLSVSDSRGAALSVFLDVSVSASSGASEVKVGFNAAPRVMGLTSSQSYLDVGQPTTVSLSATDTDGDALSYQWSATCAGSFSGVTSASATFTPSALPTAACNNCQLNVVVGDGRGGQNTGSLALCVAKSPVWGAPSVWTPTGAMTLARNTHTATLLPNGKVLVAGGQNSSGISRTAELYDPATGTWSPTGSLSAPRQVHTATLLPNGKVLVVAGYGPPTLATAELYDPATGTWSPTGSLSKARYWHTATLLPNGKVLVAGGYNSGAHLGTAELYDPATGTWSPTGSMATSRYDHAAALLPDGRVLVSTGDQGNGSYVLTSEVYDPATGTWSATSSNSARYHHSATLLATGKVLITGGYAGSPLALASLYDPATGTWKSTGSMTVAHRLHTTTLLASGKVLVTGGQSSGGYTPVAEVYDPATGTWTATKPLSAPRRYHTATRLPDGRVLIAGGGDPSSGYLATAEVYDPALGP